MKTPQQIRNEVKKGCGDKYIGLGLECGNKRSFNNERIYYCPICLAKLSILTEYDKSIKEKIERLKYKVENEKWDYDDKYVSVDIQRSKVIEWINKEFSQLEDDEVKTYKGLPWTKLDNAIKSKEKDLCKECRNISKLEDDEVGK